MRLWNSAGPDVDRADALPWDMPLARAVRPFGTAALTRLCLTGAFLYGASGLAGLGYALAADQEARHETLFVVFNVLAIAMAVGLVGYATLPAATIRRWAPVSSLLNLWSAPVLVSFGVWSAGPELAVVAVAYVEAPLYVFYMFRTRWAVVHSAWVLGCVGFVLAVQDGWTAAPWVWALVAANIVGTGVTMGLIASRSDQLAASEHDARVELAALNHTLEDRVAAQVTEIEQLGGLRRFLSRQVADVVLAGDSSALTQPHRSRVAVFFCDLRGFTAFTNHAEPEDVITVLDEYYRAVGGLLEEHGATVGDYAGDGIMAYVGDPVPRDDAAMAAVRMAAALGPRMADVVDEWRRRGHDLGYGVGLSYGYVTLGVVGFDGRYDYKPVGSVVNLAARLCSAAGPAQVLLDHAIHAETAEAFTSDPVPDLDLKGFGEGVRAYVLRG